MSNEKIAKILSALKQLVQTYYQDYNKKQGETEEDVMTEMQQGLTEQLQMKTGLKQGIITELVTSLNKILTEQIAAVGSDRKKLF